MLWKFPLDDSINDFEKKKKIASRIEIFLIRQFEKSSILASSHNLRGWKFLLNFEIAIVCSSREEFKPSEIVATFQTRCWYDFVSSLLRGGKKKRKKGILHKRDLVRNRYFTLGRGKTRHYSKRCSKSRGLFSALLILLHSKFLFSPAIEFITRRIYRGLNRRNGMLEGCKDEIEHVDKNERAGEREVEERRMRI